MHREIPGQKLLSPGQFVQRLLIGKVHRTENAAVAHTGSVFRRYAHATCMAVVRRNVRIAETGYTVFVSMSCTYTRQKGRREAAAYFMPLFTVLQPVRHGITEVLGHALPFHTDITASGRRPDAGRRRTMPAYTETADFTQSVVFHDTLIVCTLFRDDTDSPGVTMPGF